MVTENAAVVLYAERQPLPGVAEPAAHQLYRRPRLRIEPRPLGALRPGYVRVRMALVGICGTDLHVARTDPRTGYMLGSVPLDVGPAGRILGHEGVGRVTAVGDGVATLARGDDVTFESLLSCQACTACRRGQFNHCVRAQLIGAQVDGLFREVVDLPAQLAHRVTDLTRTAPGRRAAACIEPAACAYVAAARAALRPGERVVIFGAGPIGLFAAMLCRTAFGARLEVVEPVPLRRELVRPWCDQVWDVEAFFGEPATDPVDVVIETSGDTANVDRIIDRLAPCARVALLARKGQPLHVAQPDHLITRGIALFGSRGHLGGAVEDVLRLYRAGRLPLEAAVTGEVDGLGGLERTLSSDAAFERQHVKVLARLDDDRH